MTSGEVRSGKVRSGKENQVFESPHWLKGQDYTIWIVLGCVLVIRIAYLALVPFDLVHDEAYYWDWSRQLDWCYYSKPPGIAWLIALSTKLGGSNPFFVRLPAAVLSTITCLFVYLLGTRMFDRRTGLVAALVLCATPGNMASGVMMTIDAPFLCCWAAALYGFWRMLEKGPDRLVWVTVTTLAVGIGLLFKQTMLAFPCLAGSFALISVADRCEWRRRSFWACGLGALCFTLPILYWNFHHDWITFAHTRGHFEGETASVSMLKRLSTSGEFLGSQVGLLSPVTTIMLCVLAWLCVRSFRTLGRQELFLAWFWVGPILAVSMLSLTQRVEANWPAPFYASGIVLFAAAALNRLPHLSLPNWTLRSSLAVGACCVAVTYVLPFAIIGMGWKATPIDIAVRMWGWQELGQELHTKLAAAGADQTPILVVADRGVAAELAFYLPGQPHVSLWDSDGHIDSQYDIWGPREVEPGEDLVVVSRSKRIPEPLGRAFEQIESLDVAHVPISAKRSHTLFVWRATQHHGDVSSPRLASRQP